MGVAAPPRPGAPDAPGYPHTGVDMAAPVPVPPEGFVVQDGVLLELQQLHEKPELWVHDPDTGMLMEPSAGSAPTPDVGSDSAGPTPAQQLNQNRRYHESFVATLEGALAYRRATGAPYVPSRRDRDALVEASQKLDRGTGRILVGEQPVGHDKIRRIFSSPLSEDVKSLIEAYTNPKTWELPPKDADELRAIQQAHASGQMTEEQARTATTRMRQLLRMQETHDGLDVAEVGKMLDPGGAIANMLEWDEWARASSPRAPVASRPPAPPRPAPVETSEDPDQDVPYEEALRRATAWLEDRTRNMTQAEEESGIFDLVRDLADLQLSARGEGKGLFRESKTFTKLGETGDKFIDALAELIQSDEELKILPGLIAKRRIARDAKANHRTVEQLTEEEQRALAKGLSRVADYFTAITAEELIQARESKPLDRFWMRWSKGWRRAVVITGLSAAAVGSLLVFPGGGLLGLAWAASKLTLLGATAGYINQKANRMVADTDEVAYDDIRYRHYLEMKAFESLERGLPAHPGTFHEDQVSDALPDPKQLVRGRVGHSQHEMSENTRRAVRDMVIGSLVCYASGVVGGAALGGQRVIESAAADFVVHVLGEHLPVNVTVGLGTIALTRRVAWTHGKREKLRTQTELLLEDYLARRGGHLPPASRFADIRARAGAVTRSYLDDGIQFFIRPLLQPLFPRSTFSIPEFGRQLRLRRAAIEEGAKHMTPDDFFRFAQDNKEMLLQLRETYSSRRTRRKAVVVRPQYDEFMTWAIQHAGVFSSEEEKTGNEKVDEDVLQAMYTGLQQRIDRMLDEVRGRKVERKYKEGYEDARRAQRSLSNNGRLPVRI